MKGAIKKMRIDVQFKDLVSVKMKEFIVSSRTEQSCMFRANPQTRLMQSTQIKFLSVGEWVEVQGGITPGWNSEGGVGVITKVTDGLADVKICFDPLGGKTYSAASPHHYYDAPSWSICSLTSHTTFFKYTWNNRNRCFEIAFDECDPTTKVWHLEETVQNKRMASETAGQRR
jgi:hypothetical protein